MPPLVIPNTMRANIYWSLNSVDTAVNVLHFQVGSGFLVNTTEANAFAQIVANARASAWGTAIGSTMANDWAIARVSLRDLRVANQAEITSTTGLPSVGTGTASVIPAANAVVVTLRTASAGRSYRGRVYVPGWASNAVFDPNGTISLAARTAAAAFVDEVRFQMTNTRNAALGVMSPTLGEINPVVQVLTRDNQWDVQRRRNSRGGL